jgi:hypothetical protein
VYVRAFVPSSGCAAVEPCVDAPATGWPVAIAVATCAEVTPEALPEPASCEDLEEAAD